MMDIKQLISQMTLAEKATLCAGGTNWDTKPIPRLGIPSVMLADGPHGLRKQFSISDDLSEYTETIVSVCFPCSAALAATFDRSLIRKMGEALGNACQAENVAVLLGPGANIKRSPLCGRNFEYYSEDPLLSGEIAGAFIQGMQSKNVAVSLKHFCMNNQETRRMSVDARADERTMREIYLASFETAIKQGQPWTVMSAYNKINGVYGSENRHTLTEILREEWGFSGLTISDWGGVNDRAAGLAAGLDLEMPFSGLMNDQKLISAVESGAIPESVLDQAVERILQLIDRFVSNRDEAAVFNLEADHQTTREIAENSIVLLKNENQLLPLNPNQKIAFIGQYAASPRYQGSGSSFIRASRVSSALETARAFCDVQYARGFDDSKDCTDALLLDEALELTKSAEVAVVFAGLPDSFESEGFDRLHLRMPDSQNHLIAEIAKVNPNVVVVLHNGAPIEMPWVDDAAAIVETYLAGEAGGEAVAEILFGRVNPSGKLAETFPLRLEDTPAFLNYPGDGDIAEYKEGIYVGYRYYDTRRMPVLFPFGHGLSYTHFEYSNLIVNKTHFRADESLEISFDLTNTGELAGKEAVQVYIHSAHAGISRPEQELKAFEKVELAAGETRKISFRLPPRAFAYYETKIRGWHVEGGDYEIRVGASSRDIRLTARVTVKPVKRLPVQVTPDTILSDLLTIPGAEEILMPFMTKAIDALLANNQNDQLGVGTTKMFENTLLGLPLHALQTWVRDEMTDEIFSELLEKLQALDSEV